MGIEQISNSALLAQLEQMNRQMGVMQNSLSYSPSVNQNLEGQAAFFNGESAARALRDDAMSINASAQSANASAAGTATSGAAGVNHSYDSIAPENAGQTVGEFKQLLVDAFENVNILQNQASEMQSRFDVGDRSITLADVMIASQKSSLSFEATLQIRNRLVEAYQSIMQMQI